MKIDMNDFVVGFESMNDAALDIWFQKAFDNKTSAWSELTKHYNDQNHAPCCPEWDAKLAICNMNYQFWKAAYEALLEESQRRNPDDIQGGY